jgi:hypothetical protein
MVVNNNGHDDYPQMNHSLGAQATILALGCEVPVHGTVLWMRGQVSLKEHPHEIAFDAQERLDKDPEIAQSQSGHNKFVVGRHALTSLRLLPSRLEALSWSCTCPIACPIRPTRYQLSLQ